MTKRELKHAIAVVRRDLAKVEAGYARLKRPLLKRFDKLAMQLGQEREVPREY